MASALLTAPISVLITFDPPLLTVSAPRSRLSMRSAGMERAARSCSTARGRCSRSFFPICRRCRLNSKDTLAWQLLMWLWLVALLIVKYLHFRSRVGDSTSGFAPDRFRKPQHYYVSRRWPIRDSFPVKVDQKLHLTFWDLETVSCSPVQHPITAMRS